MNWLRNLINRWINGGTKASKISNATFSGFSNYIQPTGSITITLTAATGGTIVSTCVSQDAMPNINNLYILQEDADIGESLNKIITVEKLRA